MPTRIQLRRDTAAAWAAANPVLASGEKGVESNTGREKTGDGTTPWVSLGYTAATPGDLTAATAATTTALAAKAIAIRPGIRVIELGDSIKSGGTLDATVPGQRDPLWWAQFYSDQTILWQRNAGIPGDTSGDVPGWEGAPTTAPTLAASGAGPLTGTYRYAVAFVLPGGDTIQGPDALITVAAQTVTVSNIPVGPAGTTARKLFRTIAGGATSFKKLVTTLAGNVTTVYVDSISDATITAAANPTVFNPFTPHGMLGRLQTDVIAFAPDWCALLCGTNDMAFNVTLANFAANVTAIWQALRTAGIRMVLGTIPPRGAGSGFDSLVDRWNGWLRNFAATNNIPLADYHAAMVDPTTAQYLPIYNSDGTHPSAAGAATMGRVLAATLKPYVSPAPAASIAQHNVAGVGSNMVSNPLFLTSAGGLGTGWGFAGSGGAFASIVADPTIKGNWQRITQPAGGTGNVLLFQNLPGPAAGLGWAPGDRVRLSALVRFIFAGRVGAGANLVVLANGVALPQATDAFPDYYAMPDSGVNAVVAAIDTGKRVACGEFVIPVACTDLALYGTLGTPNLDGGSLDIAEVSVNVISRVGIPSRLAVPA